MPSFQQVRRLLLHLTPAHLFYKWIKFYEEPILLVETEKR